MRRREFLVGGLATCVAPCLPALSQAFPSKQIHLIVPTSAGGVHVARALLAEFATNIANVIAQRRQGDVNGSSNAVPEPAPAMSGSKILGRALLDGARGVMGKVSGKGDRGSE